MVQAVQGRVVAQTQVTRGMFGMWASLFLLQTLMLAWRAHAHDDGGSAVLAVLAAVAAVASFAALLAGPKVQLRLTPDTLEIVRWLWPLAIARTEISGVDGNVPGRPKWSEQVVLKTAQGQRKLPLFVERPAVLVPLLQAWVDTGVVPEADE